VNTCDTAVRVRGVVRFAKVLYCTRTRITRFESTAGKPVPVRKPTSGTTNGGESGKAALDDVEAVFAIVVLRVGMAHAILGGNGQEISSWPYQKESQFYSCRTASGLLSDLGCSVVNKILMNWQTYLRFDQITYPPLSVFGVVAVSDLRARCSQQRAQLFTQFSSKLPVFFCYMYSHVYSVFCCIHTIQSQYMIVSQIISWQYAD